MEDEGLDDPNPFEDFPFLAASFSLGGISNVHRRRARHRGRLRAPRRLDLSLESYSSVEPAAVEDHVLAQRALRELAHESPDPDVVRKDLL